MGSESDIDISQVEGNASPEIKRILLGSIQSLMTRHVSRSTGELFRNLETELAVASRLRLTEISVLPKAEEPEKFEGRVVFEVIADKCAVTKVSS